MNTLSNVEAERVSQILRSTIDRINMLKCVPSHKSDQLLDAVRVPKVHAALLQQWHLEEQLRSVKESLADMAEELGGVDIVIMKQLYHNTRGLCRLLNQDVHARALFLDYADDHPNEEKYDFNGLDAFLTELQQQYHRRLTTTVEDEARNRYLQHELTERQRQAEENRDVLQQQLQTLRAEKDRVTLGLDQVIRKLQAELDEVGKLNDSEVQAIQKEMTDTLDQAATDHQARSVQLHERFASLTQTLAEESESHREVEAQLRRYKSRLESQLSAKIKAYDSAMKERSDEIRTIREQLTAEEAEYRVLKEHFDKIDANTDRMKEENRRLLAVKARNDAALKWMDDTAATIQKIVRGRQTRAEVAKLKSKKSKKGKKGGKGKKAKK